MSLRDLTGNVYFRVSNWVADHNGEVLWAGAFGILFAAMAWFFAPPKPDPYWIYVLADHHTDTNTMRMLLSKAASSQAMPVRRVDQAPVEIQVDQLADDLETTIRSKAEEISRRSDVLLVLGHLPSQLAETSLQVFFEARPQIPFIATVSSDDDLLSRCVASLKCFDGNQFAPLLQLSPTNGAQGQSAVTYATIRGKRRFLIAYDNDSQNAAYTTNLVGAYVAAIAEFNRPTNDTKEAGSDPAVIVGEYKMDQPPSLDALKEWNSDCVLYAGGMGEGLGLLKALSKAKLPTMVIFSDSTVQDAFSPEKLRTFPGTLFTNQIDAVDYNEHRNVYVEDAFAIAGQLIDDVQNRGEDMRLRIKTFVHIQTGRDVRANLDHVMKQNAISHGWYKGTAPDSIYAFDSYRRFGGLFHVWQLRSATEVMAQMDDVDHWHVPRTPQKTDAQKVASAPVVEH
jgi:hypothetical protein